MDNKQKCISLIAILLALMAYSAASSISSSTINQTVGLNIIVNNTNLGPNTTESFGTGERIQGTIYFNNNTDIEIFVWGHAQNISQTAELHLFINGTKVADTSGRALGSAEQSNKTIVAIIPRYSSYKIEAVNAHHYEWREYQILSGNGSGSSSCTNCANQTQLNLKVNKSGDTMTGTLTVGTINNSHDINITANTSGTMSEIYLNGGFAYIFGFNTKFNYNAINNTFYIHTPLNMTNHNITNCANCVTTTDLAIANISISNINNTFDMSINPITIESSNSTLSSTIQLSPDAITLDVTNGTNSGITILDSGVFIGGDLDMTNNSIINCANCDSYSKLVNRTYNSTGQVSTGTNTIPHDDTIPLITEGFNVLNLTVTPKSASHYYKICGQIQVATSNAGTVLLGSFITYNGSTVAMSNAYSPAANFEVNTGQCAFVQANTTNAVSIQLRAGSNGAGTLTINGAAGGRTYGGVYNTYLVADEYVP